MGNPVLIVIFVAVAVQQPYAMRWSMTNGVSPASVALGNNVQKRSVSRCSSLKGLRDVAMKSFAIGVMARGNIIY